jgi:hypothetical protein
MKSSPSLGAKARAGAGKKRSHCEVEGSARDSSPPTSPPSPNSNKEWKKLKAKTEDLLALVNSGFLREKEMDMWRPAAGDPYSMEKNPDEIPMFARFVERGVALPASDFFKGLHKYYGIEYLKWNPNGIFHVSVFVHSLCGDQAPLDIVPEILPCEAVAERQRPTSSHRSRHSDA